MNLPRGAVLPAKPALHDRIWRRGRPRTAGALLGLVLVGAVLLWPRPGNPAPAARPGDFRLAAYQGQDVLGGQQASFSHVLGLGKPVILNFFAGQCPSCRVEMPGLQRAADAYRGRAVVVGLDVGPFVGLGDHQDAVRLLRELKISYPAGYALDAIPLSTYQVLGMPTTVFFNRSGKVVKEYTGSIVSEAELQAELAELTG